MEIKYNGMSGVGKRLICGVWFENTKYKGNCRPRIFSTTQFFMDSGVNHCTNIEVVGRSIDMDDNGEIHMMECSDEAESPQDRDDSTNEESSRTTTVLEDEPYVGQQFESEAAAHAFYKAYALRVGFIVRQSKLSRSKRDGSPIGRILVCNKEGHRCPNKREKIVRQRSTTRIGCQARLITRKSKTGKWLVSRFVKEHTHSLTPVQGYLLGENLSAEEKIRKLSEEVDLERGHAETYKQHLDILFEQVEGQDNSLSEKIQEIVNKVKEMEVEEKQNRDHLNHILS